MTNPNLPPERAFGDRSFEVLQFANIASQPNLTIFKDSDSSGVIASIFKAL